ncbi:hypothetical protein [Nocardioides sp. KR10-350]|uniref:Dyp-type peroxidase n=1 Tax=Nocardioides cheoyonin TaxID=3156615 RepID=UPI0032B5F077
MPGKIDLAAENKPFDATATKYQQMLGQLQGNIIKSHGRDFASHLFFKLDHDPFRVRRMISRLLEEGFITSAAEQAAQTQRRHDAQKTKKPHTEEVFGTLLFSARGLARAGLSVPAGFGDSTAVPAPAGPPPVPVGFSEPMRHAAVHLGDNPSEWEPAFRKGDLDGLLIIAYGTHHLDDPYEEEQVVHAYRRHVHRAWEILSTATSSIHEERGVTQVVGGKVREHFGYADGVSQPLFTTQELPKPEDRQQWDPSNGLVNLLVDDPFTSAPDAFASFYVFRKLEQNVAAFNQAVEDKAKELDNGIGVDLVGAMAVGRFKDGAPVLLHDSQPQPVQPYVPENDFTYADDPGVTDGGAQGRTAGATRCPFHAHIRKTNPRGDVARAFGPAADAGERAVRIARRGITYGHREADFSDAPETGVGLLFQCYQANLGAQFAFMQQNWVTDEVFVNASAGQDAVIGTGARRTAQTWPTVWDDKSTLTPTADLGEFVTNKGGEFFLAPSIATLRKLGGA